MSDVALFHVSTHVSDGIVIVAIHTRFKGLNDFGAGLKLTELCILEANSVALYKANKSKVCSMKGKFHIITLDVSQFSLVYHGILFPTIVGKIS